MGKNIIIALVVVGLIGSFMGGVWMADTDNVATPEQVAAESDHDRDLAECLIHHADVFWDKHKKGYPINGGTSSATFGSLAAAYAEAMCAEQLGTK